MVHCQQNDGQIGKCRWAGTCYSQRALRRSDEKEQSHQERMLNIPACI